MKKRRNFQHFGKSNHQWIDKNPSYGSVHTWLDRNFKKLRKCQHCSSTRFVEWALKKGHKHDHNRDSYLCLCSSCHKKYDYTTERRKKLSKIMTGRSVTWGNRISATHVKIGHKPTKEAYMKGAENSVNRKRNNKGQFI